MNKNDFYKKQYLSAAEMDAFQDYIDDGVKDFLLAHGYQGIVDGLIVQASAGAPTFDAVVTAGTAYDKDGEHVHVAVNQTIDISVDELGNTTYTDLGGGEDRWVSIFLHFDRALSEPRVDGDGVPLHYVHAESFTIRVVNGTKGAAPVTEPALHADDILLADIYFYNGIADVVAGDIHVHRREEIGYYRSATGGLVKHKNDTMSGPDTDCIEETLDSDVAISGYRKYGDRYVEYRDRQHVRIPSRLAEFDDDFFANALINWWLATPTGAPVESAAAGGYAWGAYAVRLRNGNNDEWLLTGYVLTALENQPVFEVAIYSGQVPDAEHAIYFGLESVANIAHTHTEEGFGFYHDNAANWKAVSHDGVAATTTDTLVPVDITKFQRLRAHLITDTAGLVLKILYYIDDALVATHTTNLPATLAAAFWPFVNYASRVAPAITADKDMALDRFFMGGLRRLLHE